MIRSYNIKTELKINLLLNFCVPIFTQDIQAKSAGVVEYTDCIFEEG